VLELEDVSGHLIVVGGGYIGLEFSQIFRRFGSRVTVLARGSQLMNKEDQDVAVSVKEILENEGIDIILESSVKRCKPAPGGGVTLSIDHDGESKDITGSHVLFAIGRVSNSDTINVEAAGINTNKRGYISVDDYCRTNVDGVFAVGDVNGHGAFTHTAVYDAEIVLDYHKGGPRKLSDRIPVYALFCDPPLGRVGLSEKEALEKGHKVLKATREMSRISRAKEMGETQGFAKLLVDADSDLIIGASIIGPGADEIINMFAAYMYGGLPCKNYRKSMLVHPTISELMPWVLDGLKPIH
ncbi:MAG: FAD-dependent oxidoreductase, partial [Rhodothermaceae bacterium]|nr:FAD-dependent oxidoreductase [Rhodothermaceae bacterium]